MEVIVYSSSTCPYCEQLKEFLDENHIDYVEKDILENKENAEEAMKKSGQASVPIIDIDGTIIIGFDKTKLSHFLKI